MRWLVALAAATFVQLAAAEAPKVAVVDMERALFLSEPAKASHVQFEKDNKNDIDKLKDLQQTLLKIKEKMDKEGDVMSEEERRKQANAFEETNTEYKFYGRKLQQAEQKWKQDFFQTQLPEVEKSLKAIIDQGGYDVVLQAGAVVYSAPQADLTKLLLERLNSK
ncbi:OmpH family outer membrane protein [Thalassolituus sp. LLYu03]|uniref:OmpH family outer membrane protein n=1 Tax=Thalassolituus sp. LLYu03 TaxID=3421656 RepID=UPI003D2C8A41